MFVVHVTTVHRRDDIRIFHKECRAIADAGYRVALVVSDGLGNQCEQGIRIVDLGRRPAGRLQRLLTQGKRAEHAIRSLAPSLVHLHDPELLPLGRRLSALGYTVIYDAHEDLPRQVFTKQWIPAVLRRVVSVMAEHWENYLAGSLSAIVATTPRITERFAGSGRRVVTVPNYPRVDELAPDSDVDGRERAVCYIGGLMRSRGLLVIVRAVALVPDLKLILCGEFEDTAFEAELRAEPGWSRVEYRGHVGREALRLAMARCRAGLLTLLPYPSYLYSLPIKLFEYMSAGLPVVASDFPGWRSIISTHDCGLLVDPLQPDEIASALSVLLDDSQMANRLGAAGSLAVRDHYHWQVAEAELLHLYGELTGGPDALQGHT